MRIEILKLKVGELQLRREGDVLAGHVASNDVGAGPIRSLFNYACINASSIPVLFAGGRG